jgi:hypothetical protein
MCMSHTHLLRYDPRPLNSRPITMILATASICTAATGRLRPLPRLGDYRHSSDIIMSPEAQRSSPNCFKVRDASGLRHSTGCRAGLQQTQPQLTTNIAANAMSNADKICKKKQIACGKRRWNALRAVPNQGKPCFSTLLHRNITLRYGTV